MRNALNILAVPSEVFERLKLMPRWGAPFALVTVGYFILNWLKRCGADLSIAFEPRTMLLPAISSPIVVLLVWLALALVLSLMAFLVKGNWVSYKGILSVVAHSGVIYLLGEIVNFLLTHSRLLDSSLFVVPNRFPIGLDIVLWGREADLYLAVLLHSINLFTVWYLAVLAIGISTVAGLSRAKSAGLVIAIWALGVGFVLSVVLVAGGTTMRITL